LVAILCVDLHAFGCVFVFQFAVVRRCYHKWSRNAIAHMFRSLGVRPGDGRCAGGGAGAFTARALSRTALCGRRVLSAAGAAAAAAVGGAGQYAHETLIAFCIDAAVAGLMGELSTADDDKRGDTGSGTAIINFCWRTWGIEGGNRCLNRASGALAAGCSRS
jgi:hypothetical protein